MNLLDRKNGIGGSECAAVMGLSKWATPYEIYQRKIGEAPEQEDNDAMWWGRELEPIVIKRYELETGNKIYLPLDEKGNQKTIINAKYPWLFAHLDGLVVSNSESSNNLVFEAKTTGFFGEEWGEEGSDKMPSEYLMQCAHYCIVASGTFPITGAELAAVDGRKKLRIYRYNRNKELEQQIIDTTHDFWHNHVLVGEPPEYTSRDDLNKIFKTCKNTPIIASSDIYEKYCQLTTIREEIKTLDESKEALENEIKLYIRENSELIDVSGKILVTWKSSVSNTLDKKKLEASGINLAPFYTEKERRTFLIKK